MIFDIGMKILLVLTSLFFLIFFLICAISWAVPANPERRYTIGFLVSSFATFLFFLGGLLLFGLVLLLTKLFPLIKTLLVK